MVNRSLVLDHPRGHDARHRASERRQHGDERLAVQSHPGHQLVHQVGGPGHVAAVFQHRDEQEEDQDLGQEDEHSADAAQHPVDQKAAQRSRGHPGLDPLGERGKPGVDPGHERPGPGIHALEHHHHHEGEDDHPPHGMGKHAIDPVGAGDSVLGRSLEDSFQHVVDPVVACLGFHAGHRAARLGQPSPCLLHLAGDLRIGFVEPRPLIRRRCSRSTLLPTPGTSPLLGPVRRSPLAT